MNRHTPGPWEEYMDNEFAATIEGPKRENGVPIVALVYGIEGEGLANRRLICAAPDLLTACEAAADALDAYIDLCDQDRRPVSQADRGLHKQLFAALKLAKETT